MRRTRIHYIDEAGTGPVPPVQGPQPRPPLELITEVEDTTVPHPWALLPRRVWFFAGEQYPSTCSNCQQSSIMHSWMVRSRGQQSVRSCSNRPGEISPQELAERHPELGQPS